MDDFDVGLWSEVVEDGLGWVCLVLLVVFWLYEP